MAEWLPANWLTIFLLLVVLLLAALIRAAGGSAAAWRIVAGLLPSSVRAGASFERAYLEAVRVREATMPALISRENLRSLSLIQAFALLRLVVPG